ncbi:sodium:solute symporter family protein [Candidatus Kapaibacterium sp.]
MTLSSLDIIVILVYFALVLYIGFFIAKKKGESNNSKEDFILAGRKLTLPLFVATLVATWYGSILGVGEFVYKNGFVAWICFGFPYYVAAVVFSLFVAEKIRKANVVSIPEQIKSKYGAKAGVVASLIVLIITVPAAYILMLGVVIQLFSGLSIEVSIIIGAVVSLIYLFNGGFKADVYTNVAQFFLMYLGFFVLIVFTFIEYGSFNSMFALLPENHRTMDGGFTWQVILTWFIIAFQTFVDPSFHQRCSAVTEPRIARNGILVSVVLWAIFDFMTLTAGLYAKAYLDVDNPLMSFPILAENVLPAFWKGIFIISILATIMSTLDSYSFLSAVTIGNDILRQLSGFNKFTDKQLINYGLLCTGFLGIIIAILIPSAVEIIYKSASIAVPGLILPLLISMNRKFELRPRQSLIIMLFSSQYLLLLWTVLQWLQISITDSIEPMIAGMFVSLIITLIFIKGLKS